MQIAKAVVRQFQQKLADTLKMQFMSVASLESMSCYHANLDDEVQDWNKKLCQLTSQTDDLSAELEAASSECLHLSAKNQVLRQELLSMKIQAESQGNLEQLGEKNNASIRSQMEPRIKDLKSELS